MYRMALKAMVSPEEFQSLHEPIQQQYVPRDGKYYLDVLPGAVRGRDGKERTIALEDVTALKAALGQERTAAAELTRQLKAYEGIDDPQAARQAMARVRQWVLSGSDEKLIRQQIAEQQMEDQYRSIAETLNRRLAAARQEAEELTTATQNLAIEGKATVALTKLGARPAAQEALLDVIRQNCRCRRVEVKGKGCWLVEVLDGNGNVRITNATGSIEPMGIEELVGEMKAGQYAFAFEGQRVESPGATDHSPGVIPSLPPVERLKLARRGSVPTD
jgi:hypothetical protein